jgi:hypothetical protein
LGVVTGHITFQAQKRRGQKNGSPAWEAELVWRGERPSVIVSCHTL